MALEKVTFLSGMELPDKSLLVAAQDAEVDIADDPHTLILHRDPSGEWEEIAHTPWPSAGISANGAGDGLALVAPWGKSLDYRMDGHAAGPVMPGADEEDPPSVLRFCKSIGGEIYSGGTDRHLFRWGSAAWQEFGVAAMQDGPAPRSFENLAGYGRDELYAFGWDGIMWTNAGGSWHQVETPTNVILNDGDVAPDRVYVAGQMGTIIEGRSGDWRPVDHDETGADIWSVRIFQDQAYFSTANGILRIEDGAVTMFAEPNPGMRATLNLFVGPSGLYSVSARDIALFDGEDWTTIAQT